MSPGPLAKFPFESKAWRAWLPAIFLIRATPPTLAPMLIWLPIAAASVTAAALVALQPGSLADLWLVREWLHHWREVGNPYHAFTGAIDYPPAAFFVLWPLAVPSDAVLPFIFLPLAVGGMVLAGIVLARWLSDRLAITLAWYELAALAALIVSGGASRGAIWRGQTAALAVLLGALALYWSRRRPVVASVSLALCAYKPHVAVGFGLAIVLTERPAVAVWAAVGVLVMSLLFPLSLGQGPADVFSPYLDSLLVLYDGPERVRGLLSIRWVIEDLVGDYQLATVLYAVLALSTLVLLVIASQRHRDRAGQTTVAVACLLWPLLFLPHQLYHGVLAWPAVWLIMWPESGVVRRQAVRLVAVASYIIFSVFDIPRSIRLMTNDEDLALTSYMLSPLRLALLFGLILYALSARSGRAERTPAAA